MGDDFGRLRTAQKYPPLFGNQRHLPFRTHQLQLLAVFDGTSTMFRARRFSGSVRRFFASMLE